MLALNDDMALSAAGLDADRATGPRLFVYVYGGTSSLGMSVFMRRLSERMAASGETSHPSAD